MRTPSAAPVTTSLCLCLALLAACGEPREADRRTAKGSVKVVATVNGVAITDRDLEHASKAGLRGGGPAHEGSSGNVLQTVVRDELVYQKAIQLGLDRDEEYAQRLEDLQAQVRAFQRQEMASRYRRYVEEHAAVTDAEVRRYFDEHAALIQTRFHVFQIFSHGKQAEIVDAYQAVKGGAPFEEVAWRPFAGMPREGTPPWDLGELAWHQLPPSWRGVADRLEPGQVSDVLSGPGERYWVIKLAGKRIDPAITFETEKGRIAELLRQERAVELQARTLEELRKGARIVYSK